MQRALLLDVVVAQGAAVLELLAGEDEALLVGWNPLLVCTVLLEAARIMRLFCECERTLDLGLDIIDGVRRLHLKGDSLAREGFDEDLHGGDLGAVSLLLRSKSIK